ncbi:STAS domain-containing protein [Longispora sp. NPDC051575]|uniref:STAS domain-containing protein n=1 Tax=Longispora sp. NPDC051575 TaxID=3154943 RepID=UPI00342F3913
MTLTVTARPVHDGRVELIACGEIDYATSADLRAAITLAATAQPTPTRIAVDLSAVALIDSTGIGTLVVGRRLCAQVGIELTVGAPSVFCDRVLRAAGVEEVLGLPCEHPAT